MTHQLFHLGGHIGLVGQRGGEQPCGVQRLHQVVTHGGQEAALGLAGPLGLGLGLQQRLVQLRQLAGSLVYAPLQAFVGFLQRLFCLAEGRNIGKAHDKAAARHRVADDLDHAAIGEHALGAVRRALLHPGNTLVDVHLRVTRATEATPRVVQNDVGNRPANGN